MKPNYNAGEVLPLMSATLNLIIDEREMRCRECPFWADLYCTRPICRYAKSRESNHGIHSSKRNSGHSELKEARRR